MGNAKLDHAKIGGQSWLAEKEIIKFLLMKWSRQWQRRLIILSRMVVPRSARTGGTLVSVT